MKIRSSKLEEWLLQKIQVSFKLRLSACVDFVVNQK